MLDKEIINANIWTEVVDFKERPLQDRGKMSA